MDAPDDDLGTRQREFRAIQQRRRQQTTRRAAWDFRDDKAPSPDVEGPRERPARRREPDLWKRRRVEMAKLDTLEGRLFDDLHRARPVVDRGRVVLDPYTGEPLVERRTDLAVFDRILRIAARRAKVRGIDAPRRREQEEITEDILVEQIDLLFDQIDILETTANEEAED